MTMPVSCRFVLGIVAACAFAIAVALTVSTYFGAARLGVANTPGVNARTKKLTHFRSGQFGTSVVAISNTFQHSVTIYEVTQNGRARQVGLLSTELFRPQGMSADVRGNLYVAESIGSWIDMYQLGANRPSRRISIGVGYCPVDVAVGPQGNLYVVATSCTDTLAPGGEFAEFDPGASFRSVNIDTPGELLSSVAVDHAGRVYLGENDAGSPNSGHIVRFDPASVRLLDTGIVDVSFVGGLAFDSQDTIYAVDRGHALIKEFPIGSTQMTRAISDGLSSPGFIAIDTNDMLYVANASGEGLSIYRPQATSPLKTFNVGTVGGQGVALLSHS
jgi:DNA-binding beta-propeller fold protein YncE